jgi:hypothetical protein
VFGQRSSLRLYTKARLKESQAAAEKAAELKTAESQAAAEKAAELKAAELSELESKAAEKEKKQRARKEKQKICAYTAYAYITYNRKKRAEERRHGRTK